ncbi:GGDEF domain-containing protein [Thalassotalea ponticola]|uniref:GGDEF domain-containing protein n=1 Tax=Thalassotalea ponticola TaxID=1523392 RepID=UPI0025B3AE94|nr:GGDEF domain-containing protein [Thalassotalea ponticola]MDN3651867.1 GGDEF domain-containing protein [Thalassotalea ponticola]
MLQYTSMIRFFCRSPVIFCSASGYNTLAKLALFALLSIVLAFNVSANSPIKNLIYQEQIDDLIHEALDVRSSDVSRSEALLQRIENNLNRMTQRQTEQYYFLKAYHLSINAQYDQAIAMHARNTASNDPYFRLRANAKMLRLHLLQEDYRMATAMYMTAKQSMASIKHRNGIYVNAITTFMMFYNDVHQYQQALDIYEQLFTTDGELPTVRQMCFLNRERIKSSYALKKINNIEATFDEAMQLCSLANEPLVSHQLTWMHANMYLDQGNLNQAYQLLASSWPDVQQAAFNLNILRYATVMAEVNSQFGNRREAQIFVDTVLNYRSKYGNHPLLLRALKVDVQLADNLTAKQRFERQQQLLMFKRQVLSKENEKALLYQAISHSIEKSWVAVDSYLQRNESERQLANNISLHVWGGYLFTAIMVIAVIASFKYIAWLLRLNRIARARLRQSKRRANYSNVTSALLRDAFIERAEQQLQVAKQGQENVSLVVVNIDMFRRIFHMHGMDISDRLLRFTVKRMRHHFGGNALIGELGNDQFAALLVNSDAEQVSVLAEQLRQDALDSSTTAVAGFKLELTISSGISDNQISGYQLQDMLSHAEKALHHAKLQWGNISLVYADDMIEPTQSYTQGIKEYIKRQRYLLN